MLLVSAVALAHDGRPAGTKGADDLTMSDGNDRVFARGGNDSVDGGAGNDRLRGGRGHDELFGGEGDDRLRGGQDDDYLDGGEGDDYINGRGDGGDGDEIVCGNGYDVAVLGRGDVIVAQADDVELTSQRSSDDGPRRATTTDKQATCELCAANSQGCDDDGAIEDPCAARYTPRCGDPEVRHARAGRAGRRACAGRAGRVLGPAGRGARPTGAPILSVLVARTWQELFDTGEDAPPQAAAADDGEPERGGFFRRLRDNMSKTRQAFGAELQTTVFQSLDDEAFERLEETLIYADVGAPTTAKIVERLETEAESGELTGGEELSRRLRELLADTARLEGDTIPLTEHPTVILVTGVNGSGKTTTIGKMAWHLQKELGQSVLLAAGDTFRAAAAEQLDALGRARRAARSCAATPGRIQAPWCTTPSRRRGPAGTTS